MDSKELSGKEILIQLMDYLKVTQEELAEATGVKKQAISSVLKDRYDLSGKNRTLISNAYPNISKDFIFEGKGSVKVSIPDETNAEKVFEEYDRIKVPVIPLEASAGFLINIDGSYRINELDFAFETIERRPGYKYSNLTAIFRVNGNSMYPHYKHSSEWLCTWVDASNWDYMEGTHVISTTDGSLLLKRIVKRDNGTLHLKSDNPEYDMLVVKKAHIQAVWKVQYSTYSPAE